MRATFRTWSILVLPTLLGSAAAAQEKPQDQPDKPTAPAAPAGTPALQ